MFLNIFSKAKVMPWVISLKEGIKADSDSQFITSESMFLRKGKLVHLIIVSLIAFLFCYQGSLLSACAWRPQVRALSSSSLIC